MLFVGFSPPPASGIVAGYAAVILKVRALRPKVEPPIFRDRTILCGLDAGGDFQDGLKTPNLPKWRSRLDGAHIFKHIYFGSFL